MIDFFFWTTPNNQKVLIFLEETGLPYEIKTVNIQKGEQFKPEYLEISPNNKVPAIRDNKPQSDGRAVSVFESGAILIYLAEKAGQLLSKDFYKRVATLEWLFWQVGGLGPIAGQNHHFQHYAPEQIPYAVDRFVTETGRLYSVLNKRLADRDYIVDDYSIADIAAYPWVFYYYRQSQDLAGFPNLQRWFNSISERPAVKRAWAIAREINTAPNVNAESRKILFAQKA
jgi:GST-like protein